MKVMSFGENDCIEYNFVTSADFSGLMIQKVSRSFVIQSYTSMITFKNTFSTLKEDTFYRLK
ncbi:hypothetical protein V1477_005872 [Vespula maculifrons]|uniref:Uncharacterized protein n=1 Tax=Vespula maculifrons TaxID=7453 RepID=A0ABD2CMB8_VESMC